jgi:hypothetical protein
VHNDSSPNNRASLPHSRRRPRLLLGPKIEKNTLVRNDSTPNNRASLPHSGRRLRLLHGPKIEKRNLVSNRKPMIRSIAPSETTIRKPILAKI